MNPASQLTQIGKYKILSELGRGGMGVVYRAEDRFIGREVAIKTLADATPQMRQRFAIEARSGILNHPNIVTVYDFGEHEGNPYIVMEFLHGQTLERIIKDGHPLTLVDKLEIIRQVCEGLGYAHSRGVVHRDIKPANVIMLPNGCAKLVDFGIAQLETLSGHTMAGSVIGTYQYLSPERLKGEPSDGRADIWSAGVLLYLLLTGTLPFPGEDISALHRVITDPYPTLASHLSTNYPDSLDNIVARALAKDPADRYATALEMAGDLEATRDTIRLSRVEDLLGQARTLIDRNELLRARPLLLDLQRLAPQNTAVRGMLREVGERLTQQPEPRPSVASSPSAAEGTQPTPDTPANSAAAQEEERRRRIIEQIVIEIRAQADRGHEKRALDLVHRSLERAPDDAALLALQQDIETRLALAAAASHPAEESAVVPPPEPSAADTILETPPTILETPEHAPAVTSVDTPEDLRLDEQSSTDQNRIDAAQTSEVDRPDHVLPTPETVPADSPVPLFVSEQAPAPDPSATQFLIDTSTSALAAPLPATTTITIPAPVPEPLPDLDPVHESAEAAETRTTPISDVRELVAAPTTTHAAAAEPVITPSGGVEAPANAPAAPFLASASPIREDSLTTSSGSLAHTSAVPSTSPAPVAAPLQSQPVAVAPRKTGAPVLAAAAAALLVAVVVLLFHHHGGTPAGSTTYLQVIASPYAEVTGITSAGGQVLALPAGDRTTPLRLDGLPPGAYRLQVTAPGGQRSEIRCDLTASQHICNVGSAVLTDSDLQAILRGGARQ